MGVLGGSVLGHLVLGGHGTIVTALASPVASPNPDLDLNPYYVRDRQPWAVDRLRQSVTQANYILGEYVMFVLMWHLQDFQAGLVTRCSICFDTADPGSKANLVASVYKQPSQQKCPSCFGTTFEGGIKAEIVRAAILTDTDQQEQVQARGIVHPSELNVQTDPDFRIRNGDYMLRGNGDRFYLRGPQRGTVRTGYGQPTMTDETFGYNLARASLEDPTSVAYSLPPSQATLAAALNRGQWVPQDFSDVEFVHAPLIPAGD